MNVSLVLVSIILATFAIASNSILLKERDHLSKHEKNFAAVSLSGSVIVLLIALYMGFTGRKEFRPYVAGGIRGVANRLNRGRF